MIDADEIEACEVSVSNQKTRKAGYKLKGNSNA